MTSMWDEMDKTVAMLDRIVDKYQATEDADDN